LPSPNLDARAPAPCQRRASVRREETASSRERDLAKGRVLP
jgi:hypothetical protein